MAMSQELVNIFEGDLAAAVGRHRDDVQLAQARQRDGAAFDMRVLNGAISTAILQGDDAQGFAHMNAAVRTPTTLDHPNAVVGK